MVCGPHFPASSFLPLFSGPVGEPPVAPDLQVAMACLWLLQCFHTSCFEASLSSSVKWEEEWS